ncbi:Ribosome biogenesis protein UTP30 [Candida viswanathii]|uniref:Ribosome biogenesis protein UTP30 n=1 Tax=Candida viswanathii TaxID=5486 RepID=A0A367YMI5_9ASCO|nr:Ribosome biogenesis protein UTP30 [Candida viswanathii]
MSPNEFILGPEAFTTAKKSLASLKKHHANDPQVPIHLIINIKIPLVRTKDYRPRIVPVTHKLDEPTTQRILMITKDPSVVYRAALTAKGSATEDVFRDVYSLKKVKGLSRSKKSLVRLFKEYDVVVCDIRVLKFLPGLLGEVFYARNKKVPYVVQMAKPSARAELARSKEGKLKDERCDAKYVALQIESIVGNTSYIASDAGDCLSLRIGYCDWKTEELVTNLNDVVDYLVSEKYLPVGGVLKALDNVGNVHVKTSESVSLPVFIRNRDGEKSGEGDDENDSDFDF